MLHGRLQSQYQSGTEGGHAKHVVSIIAPNVSDDLSLQIGQHGGQTLPFALTAPFGVDINPKDGEGAFTPGHKRTEGLSDAGLIASLQLIGMANDNGISGAIHGAGRKGGQKVTGDAIPEKPFFLLIDPQLSLMVQRSDLGDAGAGGKDTGVRRGDQSWGLGFHGINLV